MSLVKDGLAKAWASELTAGAGFPFFPHRYDGITAPPFGVVVVKRLRPTVPGEDVHLADVRVVVVSDAADTPVAEQQRRAGRAYAAIEATPRQAEDLENGVRLCGFMLEEIEQASGGGEDGKKIHSDVFMITAGVAAVTSAGEMTYDVPDYSGIFNLALTD
jgi:hypothetical protein